MRGEPMRFEIRRSWNGQFYWVIVGGNGEVMSQSETMLAKASCESAIRSVKAGRPSVDKT